MAIDRLPPSSQVTSSLEEQDYPAAALAPNGDIWLAYLEFKHNPDHNKLRAPLTAAPKDFARYTAAPGGDQVFVKRFSQNRWDEPIAITAPGGDLYRPAVAVDGSGRPWLFWSANESGDFDLWARPIANGTPGKTVRISKASGSDVFPAAATDSKGRVWVAWQGWRQGKAAIFAATSKATASPLRRLCRIRLRMSGIRRSPPMLPAGSRWRGTHIVTAASRFISARRPARGP